MLMVTPNAAAHLALLLEAPAVPESKTFRFVADAAGHITLEFDDARQDDIVIKHAGRPILVLGPKVTSLLSDKKLDLRPTAGLQKLHLGPVKPD